MMRGRVRLEPAPLFSSSSSLLATGRNIEQVVRSALEVCSPLTSGEVIVVDDE